MKYSRYSKSSTARRPFYSDQDVDEICTTELEQMGLMPSTPEPIRVERFIEKRFNVSPEYADMGTGILGYSRFGPQGVEAIVISKALDEEGTKVSERRLRATLAHETGHCLLHAHLFADRAGLGYLFGDDGLQGPRILCREVSSVQEKQTGYKGDWWEIQANKVIGGLLLPRLLVYKAVAPFTSSQGLLAVPTLTEEGLREAERSLAELFDVNPVVMRIRLAGLYSREQEGQMSL